MHTPMQTMRFGLTLPGQQWVKTFLQQQQYYAIQSGPAGRTLFHTGNFFNRLVREWTKTQQKINCPITRLIVHFAGLRLLSVQAVKQYSHQPGAKTQRLFSSARALPAVRNYNNRAHGGGCKFFCRLSRTGQLISSHSIYRRPGAITVRI